MRHIEQMDDRYPVKTMFTEGGYKVTGRDSEGKREGREALTEYLGYEPVRSVCARQIHSGSILLAGKDEKEDRIAYKDERFAVRNEEGYDGLVTGEKGVLLYITTADCAPVFLYDPEKHVCGVVHSGWRGTCSSIAVNAINVMKDCFGSDPAKIIAAVGPCICGDCYEVGGELKDSFREDFSDVEIDSFFKEKDNGKYLLDVTGAVRISALRAGVSPENFIDTGICTFSSEIYPSYRRVRFELGHIFSGIILEQS